MISQIKVNFAMKYMKLIKIYSFFLLLEEYQIAKILSQNTKFVKLIISGSTAQAWIE